MTTSTTTAVSPQTTRATEQFLLDAYHGLVQHARIVRDPHASDRDADEREHNADGVSAVARQISRLAKAVSAGLLDRLAAEDETMPADAYDAFTDAQLYGEACINCGREFGVDEPAEPTVLGPRGQLFEHSNPNDCGAAAESEI